MLNYILLLLETPTKAVGKWMEPGTNVSTGRVARVGFQQWS